MFALFYHSCCLSDIIIPVCFRVSCHHRHDLTRKVSVEETDLRRATCFCLAKLPTATSTSFPAQSSPSRKPFSCMLHQSLPSVLVSMFVQCTLLTHHHHSCVSSNKQSLAVFRPTPTHAALRHCSLSLPSTNLLRRHQRQIYSKVDDTSTINANSLVNIGSVSFRNSLFSASVQCHCSTCVQFSWQAVLCNFNLHQETARLRQSECGLVQSFHAGGPIVRVHELRRSMSRSFWGTAWLLI